MVGSKRLQVFSAGLLLLLGSGWILLSLAACKPRQTRTEIQKTDSTMIAVKGTITEYTPNAMRDHYDGGGFATFAKSVVTVQPASAELPATLQIYHDESEEIPACWQTVGQTVAFDLDPEYLKSTNIFRDALENVVCE
ncbi:MAG: hypothetical protein IPN95_32555 [Bacteroidetes bacterium]|nr:hypothetical protein [Bacteroidota bacterium]MBL0015666.1 hypothetical protein [Bacteroidota bacterium]MBP6721572.1 hypothetical protein [Bacteroidia bacterium]